MVVLITGATSGLGRHLAGELTARGHVVLVHGRDAERTRRVARELPGAQPYVADLAALDQVRALAAAVLADHPVLDIVINNAGVGYGPPAARSRRQLSADGIELRFAVNYLAPYLLSRLLAGRVRDQVLNLGSLGQEPLDFTDLMLDRDYDGVSAYRRAKLALAMATFDLAERWPTLAVNVVHPATYMDTAMVREGGGTPRSTVAQGCAAVLSVLGLATEHTGTFFDGDRPARAHPDAYRPDLRARLRTATERLVR